VLVEPGMRRAAVVLLSAAREGLPVEIHPLFPAASLLGSNLALALAVVVVLFWNFSVNRLWTYSDAS